MSAFRRTDGPLYRLPNLYSHYAVPIPSNVFERDWPLVDLQKGQQPTHAICDPVMHGLRY